MKGERDLVPALVSLACGEGTERRQTEVQPRGWKRGPACTSGKLGRGGNIGSEIRRAGEISVMKTSRGEALSSQTLRKGTEVENVRRLLLYAQENEEKSGLKGETCVTLWGSRCLAGSVYFTPDALEWGTRAWAQRASRRDAPGSTGRCRSEDSTAGCRRLHLSHPLELWARPLPLCTLVSFLESGDEKTEVAVQGAGRSERMGSRQAWRRRAHSTRRRADPGHPVPAPRTFL